MTRFYSLRDNTIHTRGSPWISSLTEGFGVSYTCKLERRISDGTNDRKGYCIYHEKKRGETQLLLFRHPHAGIQIPAGTVEDGESHRDAAIREAKEETGLDNFDVKYFLGFMDELLPEDRFFVARRTKVYARPDLNSFDWAEFRKGTPVTHDNRQSGNFTHVSYNEGNKFPDPDYVTYSIVGWVPSDCLVKTQRRYFYHLEAKDETADTWDHPSDNHVFRLFWAPISNLPLIVYPQDGWLVYALNELKYEFV